jgi:fructose-bisphosphate aldolase, class II
MTDSAAIVANAFRQGLVVPAFNIPYLPMVEPVIRAVRDQDAFAFIAVARIEWMKLAAGGPTQVAEEFRKYDDPHHVRLHLDHVPVVDEDDAQVEWRPILREGIAAGYRSLMIDASRLDLEGNIAATREAVAIAHEAGIPCEAELGAVLGHEDGPLPSYEELFASGMGFTDVEQARRFVAETGCDWLSVAIGSVHGAISGTAKDKEKVAARLDLGHLQRLADATDIPLVLHGGSGVKQEAVLAAIRLGIAKVNVATEIRRPYEAAMRAAGDIGAAQDAVYQRTVWLLRDYFGVSGQRSALLP